MAFNVETSRKANIKHYSTPFLALYNRLVSSAKRGNKEIELTYDQFLEFTKVPNCEYCGETLLWIPHGKKSTSYNLDRRKNSLGYSKENCVACCKKCNFLKGSRDEAEFLNTIYKIYTLNLA